MVILFFLIRAALICSFILFVWFVIAKLLRNPKFNEVADDMRIPPKEDNNNEEMFSESAKPS